MVLVFIVLLGLLIGSFVNVLIDRLPNEQSVIVGRSKCDHCGKTLRWFELIPVISFLVQGGRCLRCKKKLSMQYPFVELLTAGIFAVLFQQFSLTPSFVASVFLATSFIVILGADFKYFFIPDSMLSLMVVGSIVWLYATGITWTTVLPYLVSSVIAGTLFYGLWVITKKKGIGFGDVKLAFVMGLLLGYPGILTALYIAFLTGAVVGVILILVRKKTMKSALPFGPFLVFGTIISLVYGERIYNWAQQFL